MNYSADVLAIRKLDWDFFVTLTHKRAGFRRVKDLDGKFKKEFIGGRWDSPNKHRQAARFNAWVYAVCRSFKIKPRNFQWVSRLEKGGEGGRDHFHLLVRLPKRCRKSVSSCVFRLRNMWMSKLGYGGAKVRSINADKGVSGYIAKVVAEYEEARFSNERYRSVNFSSAALRAMKH